MNCKCPLGEGGGQKRVVPILEKASQLDPEWLERM